METYVDLTFPIIGNRLPSDHAYSLYASLSRLIPEIHEADDLSIQTISGIPTGDGYVYIGDRSTLRIRTPLNRLNQIYRLAGKTIMLDGQSVVMHIPMINPIVPQKTLKSRITLIKGYQEPETFLEAAKKQLTERGLKCEINLISDKTGLPTRRKLKVKQHTLIGFPLMAECKDEVQSIRLQIQGLGGKHKMGCGVFFGVRG